MTLSLFGLDGGGVPIFVASHVYGLMGLVFITFLGLTAGATGGLISAFLAIWFGDAVFAVAHSNVVNIAMGLMGMYTYNSGAKSVNVDMLILMGLPTYIGTYFGVVLLSMLDQSIIYLVMVCLLIYAVVALIHKGISMHAKERVAGQGAEKLVELPKINERDVVIESSDENIGISLVVLGNIVHIISVLLVSADAFSGKFIACIDIILLSSIVVRVQLVSCQLQGS